MENECKHEKTTTKSVPPMDRITYKTQFCNDCGSYRERAIFSIKLGGLTCFSEDIGPWIPKPVETPV